MGVNSLPKTVSRQRRDCADTEADFWHSADNYSMRYDTRCYFNVRSKADTNQLNVPHGTDN